MPSPAERAARRQIAAAPQRAAWVDIGEDMWLDSTNEAATAALLDSLVKHHVAADVKNAVY